MYVERNLKFLFKHFLELKKKLYIGVSIYNAVLIFLTFWFVKQFIWFIFYKLEMILKAKSGTNLKLA